MAYVVAKTGFLISNESVSVAGKIKDGVRAEIGGDIELCVCAMRRQIVDDHIDLL